MAWQKLYERFEQGAEARTGTALTELGGLIRNPAKSAKETKGLMTELGARIKEVEEIENGIDKEGEDQEKIGDDEEDMGIGKAEVDGLIKHGDNGGDESGMPDKAGICTPCGKSRRRSASRRSQKSPTSGTAATAAQA